MINIEAVLESLVNSDSKTLKSEYIILTLKAIRAFNGEETLKSLNMEDFKEASSKEEVLEKVKDSLMEKEGLISLGKFSSIINYKDVCFLISYFLSSSKEIKEEVNKSFVMAQAIKAFEESKDDDDNDSMILFNNLV